MCDLLIKEIAICEPELANSLIVDYVVILSFPVVVV